MTVSKVAIIQRGATRLKISGITVQLGPNEVGDWLCYLDDFMASVEETNYEMGYQYPDDYGTSDANDESGLERWMVKPIATLLANDIAGSYGKIGVISQAEIMKAEEVLNEGLVRVDGAKYSVTMPVGQANEYPYRFTNFFRGDKPQQPIVRPTISISFNEIQDYSIDLRSYLEGETVTSYSITVSSGLTLISDIIDDSVVSYRIQCGNSVADKQTVNLFAETDSGRQKYFVVNVKALTNANTYER